MGRTNYAGISTFIMTGGIMQGNVAGANGGAIFDIEPIEEAIRGGTDGAMLSYMGLPCPNLFTGGANFHGRYEYLVLSSMDLAVDVLLELVKIYTEAA